ncbi:hypothetical protein DI09_551p10, partial [Mitosporidium daphniae]
MQQPFHPCGVLTMPTALLGLGVSLVWAAPVWAGEQAPQQWAQTTAQVSPAKTYPPVQVVDTALEYRQFEKVEITGS